MRCAGRFGGPEAVVSEAGASTRPDPARPRSRRPPLVREVVAASPRLFLAYRLGRLAITGHDQLAVTNAWWVWDVERTLRLPDEELFQQWALQWPDLLRAANWYYVGVHFPLTRGLPGLGLAAPAPGGVPLRPAAAQPAHRAGPDRPRRDAARAAADAEQPRLPRHDGRLRPVGLRRQLGDHRQPVRRHAQPARRVGAAARDRGRADGAQPVAVDRRVPPPDHRDGRRGHGEPLLGRRDRGRAAAAGGDRRGAAALRSLVPVALVGRLARPLVCPAAGRWPVPRARRCRPVGPVGSMLAGSTVRATTAVRCSTTGARTTSRSAAR